MRCKPWNMFKPNGFYLSLRRLPSNISQGCRSAAVAKPANQKGWQLSSQPPSVALTPSSTEVATLEMRTGQCSLNADCKQRTAKLGS